MINKISNTVLVKAISVKLTGFGKPKAVPPINSLVNVEVIEKLKSGYKILVNGSLFQSKLPGKMNIGDIILAKVISHAPFTITVDSFTASAGIDNELLSVMLSRLEIKETALSKQVLKNVLKGKKLIHKERIKRLVEYLSDSDMKIDDLLIGLLINLLWSEDDSEAEKTLKEIKPVIDMPFEDLCNLILKEIEDMRKYSSYPAVQKINDEFVFNSSFGKSKTALHSVHDKTKAFIRLVNDPSWRDAELELSDKLNSLKKLMIKYTLQKSLYARFGIYPEFVIVKTEEEFALVILNYSRRSDEKGEVLYGTYSAMHKSGLGDFAASYFSGVDRVSGEIEVDRSNLRLAQSKIEKLNNKIEMSLGVISSIKITLKEVFKNITPGRTDTLETINAIV
ncbi:MAG: hypothetical protein GXO87_11095 [Chlorobi bacterium]|nr:hypothetical protein [Chlorobiota bacterium]